MTEQQPSFDSAKYKNAQREQWNKSRPAYRFEWQEDKTPMFSESHDEKLLRQIILKAPNSESLVTIRHISVSQLSP